MKTSRLLRLAILALLLTSLLPGARPARADIAPPEPAAGSTLFPGDQGTQVRMVSEEVTIEVAAQSQNPAGEAEITASFRMHNLGESEEAMSVRFPLCASQNGKYWETDISIPGLEDNRLNASYPPIQRFSAWVDERPAPVTTTYETVLDYQQTDALGNPKNVQIPCWANFPVSFPAGEEVTVRVSYTQQGYPGYSHGAEVNYIRFTYYLFTGAGWKDTIGSADITVKLPSSAEPATVYEAWPERPALEGNEIRWHFEDFEPDGNLYQPAAEDPGAVIAGVMNPAIWSQIDRYREAVAARPEDGEAWGQLGKAYKSAVRMERGLREDEAGQEMYRLSREAYQKAVALLPKDADWHFGYADLVCWRVEWLPGAPGIAEDHAECVEQIRETLALKPGHTRTLALLEELSTWGLVDLSGPEPVFPTLTPQPSATPAPSETSAPTGTPAPSVTAASSGDTAPPPTGTALAQVPPEQAATNPPEQAPTRPAPDSAPGSQGAASSNPRPICGAALLPALAIAGLFMRRK